MVKIINDIIGFVGFGLVVYGSYLISMELSFIVAGTILIAIAYMGATSDT